VKYLTVDPGETVGWSLWEGTDLLECGQTPMWEFVDDLAAGVMCVGGEYRSADPDSSFVGVEIIVVEEWALYPWELQNLAWDKCRTARCIGAIELICRLAGIQLRMQAAQIKEQAVLGGAEDLFVRPLHENRHANDAIMHGVYYQVVEQL
jgi:hypothetical protein